MSPIKTKRHIKRESPKYDSVAHSTCYVTKKINIIVEASSKCVSRWIFAYSHFAFDNNAVVDMTLKDI